MIDLKNLDDRTQKWKVGSRFVLSQSVIADMVNIPKTVDFRLFWETMRRSL